MDGKKKGKGEEEEWMVMRMRRKWKRGG